MGCFQCKKEFAKNKSTADDVNKFCCRECEWNWELSLEERKEAAKGW